MVTVAAAIGAGHYVGFSSVSVYVIVLDIDCQVFEINFIWVLCIMSENE